MKKLIIPLFSAVVMFSCTQKTTEFSTESEIVEQDSVSEPTQQSVAVASVDEVLLSDLENSNVQEIMQKWAEHFEQLPETYRNTVIEGDNQYPIEYNDIGALRRGFSWSCGEHEMMNRIGEEISITTSESNPELAFRAGMVFFYVKNQLLNCGK